MIAFFQYIAASLSWLVLKIFTRVEIHGLKNIRDLRQPLVVVSNHESYFDPQLVGVALLGRPQVWPLRYFAQNELFYIPGLNLLIWLLGAFYGHKKKGIERALRTPLNILKRGGTVIIFPEGRRVIERPRLGEGKRGAAMLALRTDALILPMSLHTPHGLPPFLPIASRRPHVVIRIGQPFQFSKSNYSDSSDETISRATQVIMQKISDLYFQHRYPLS